MSGGLEPCRCSRPARDAAPTIAPTIFCSDRLAAAAGPGRRRSRLPQIRPDALEAPDFVGIGEKPARQDGQRGRRSGGGRSLGTLPAGTTEAQVDDMILVLEVAGEATHPVPTRTASQLQSLLYNMGVSSLTYHTKSLSTHDLC